MQYKIQYTEKYNKIYKKLTIEKQRVIDKRVINILNNGYFGDCKTLEKDLFELRIFSAGGIRIYYTINHNTIVLLLTIGFKESKEQQQKDIETAKKLLLLYKKEILK